MRTDCEEPLKQNGFTLQKEHTNGTVLHAPKERKESTAVKKSSRQKQPKFSEPVNVKQQNSLETGKFGFFSTPLTSKMKPENLSNGHEEEGNANAEQQTAGQWPPLSNGFIPPPPPHQETEAPSSPSIGCAPPPSSNPYSLLIAPPPPPPPPPPPRPAPQKEEETTHSLESSSRNQSHSFATPNSSSPPLPPRKRRFFNREPDREHLPELETSDFGSAHSHASRHSQRQPNRHSVSDANNLHQSTRYESADATPNSFPRQRQNFSDSWRRPEHQAKETPSPVAFQSPAIASTSWRRSLPMSGQFSSATAASSSSSRQSTPYSPARLQRRSTGGKFTPKFDPNRYEHGWLFRDYFQQDTPGPGAGVLADLDNSFDDYDPFSFKPAPIIFMFNLTPITPFFTSKYCFSNHFCCPKLEIDGTHFRCTEQFYMFYKARVFGDRAAMRAIMDTDDPKMMKKIGVQVQGFDQKKWYKIAIQVMVVASVKKYEQNPALRRHLFETSGTELIETNPMDTRWGIALPLTDWRVRDKGMWRGMNILGRLLTILRDRLLEREEFAAEREEILQEIRESHDAAHSVGCLQFGRGQVGPAV